MHVLPKGFHRIRHYGLLANGNRAANIAKARELTQAQGNTDAARDQDRHVMMAIGPPNDRNAVRSNRWSSTGIGGVRPMALTNGPGSGQIAILGPRSGCSAAWIGILGILRHLLHGAEPPPSSRRASSNPHSASRILGAPPSAISSLGQLPTPAVGACGSVAVAGVRNPAQEETFMGHSVEDKHDAAASHSVSAKRALIF
jgi:hypothetical protein